MAAIQIPDEVDIQFQELAARAGVSKDEYIREALLAQLDDLEDVAIAVERLANPTVRLTLEQIEKNLGLDA